MPSREKLSEFTARYAKHILGGEKSEAQVFLDHLFQVFGHAGGFRFFLWMFALVALHHVLEPEAMAQGQGVAARFPEANRVAANFPHETERYVVLNLLWDTLHEKAPDAKGKRSTYYQAAEAIRQKYMVLGGPAAAEFDERNRHLTADPAFRRSVLEKNQLTNLPVEKSAAAPRNTDVTDAMI